MLAKGSLVALQRNNYKIYYFAVFIKVCHAAIRIILAATMRVFAVGLAATMRVFAFFIYNCRRFKFLSSFSGFVIDISND